MRSVMNISLPADLAKDIERGVKEGKYSSKSELMREMIRDWKEKKFLELIEKSRAEFKAGKGKVLKSLKDLR